MKITTLHNWWIYQKSKTDQDLIKPTRFIGSIFVALSGILLYLDKAMVFFDITIKIPERFETLGYDQSTFVWLSAQTLTPIFIIFGSWLKAHKIIYLIPLYCYLLQIYFYLFDARYIDDGYFFLYTTGTLIIVIVCLELIKYLAKKRILKAISKAKEALFNE